jgi:hypothetical protein
MDPFYIPEGGLVSRSGMQAMRERPCFRLNCGVLAALSSTSKTDTRMLLRGTIIE